MSQAQQEVSGDPPILHPSTEIAKRIENTAVSRIEGLLGTIGHQALHNFVGTPHDVWVSTSRALSPDVLGIEACRDNTLEVVNFYAHRVTINGPTAGELIDVTRCVLCTASGHMFAFISEGIAADLARMIYVFGLEPWTPPVKVKVTEVKTRRGFKTYRLVPA